MIKLEELQKAVEELLIISASSVIEENGWIIKVETEWRETPFGSFPPKLAFHPSSGWNARIETKYGLVSFWKQFPSFELSQDMGGNKAIQMDGYCLNFRKVSDLSDFYS